MTRIKAHNPAKQVTGGDSSRSLPRLKYQALTEAEYNALATKDPNTLYLIRA